MTRVTRFALVLCGWFVVGGMAMPATAADYAYGKVELIRDRWGIPHVFAGTDEGAMYGLGYATAADRAFQMHYSLRIIQGRLAEVTGDVPKTRRRETAVQSDLKMRTFGFYRAAKEAAGNLDRASRSLLAAYCRGVNDSMRNNSAKLHPLFVKFELKPEPWTPADCIASWWHLGQFFATDGTRDLIAYRNLVEGGPRGRTGERGGRSGRRQPGEKLRRMPPDDASAVVRQGDVSQEWIRKTDRFAEGHGLGPREPPAGAQGPKFSHAWVVGGTRSTTGAAVLVSDPQTPVRNPSLFYEFHIRGRTFNARGIGVAGSPAILIGFTEQVAWGLTALGADQADLFRLKTDAEHPDQYCFDGRWREMEVSQETIRVRGGDPLRLTVRRTHLGPVATRFCFARAEEGEVALKRIPVCQTDGETFAGVLGMLRAKDVFEFSKALPGWRFPSANCVFGDTEGNIGFSVVGAIPIRSRHAPNQGRAAHDGTASRFDWQGMVPHELVPQVINPRRGYLLTANHRPIESFYRIPLGTMTGAGGDTTRSWRLRERLAGKKSFRPEDVLAVHYDTVNPARREIVRIGLHLRDVLDRELSVEAARALEALEAWHKAGASSDLSQAGAALAVELNTFFRFVVTDLAEVYGGGGTGLCYFLKTAASRLDKDPRADVSQLEQEYIDMSLAGAWRSAVQKYGRDPSQWTRRARAAVAGRKLGCFESLDGFGSLDRTLDVSLPSIACLDGGTIHCQAAQSYTQYVPMHDPDAAMTVLPIGQSELPRSRWRTSTIDLWKTGRLHPAPLSRTAVEKIGESSEVLLP